MNSFTKFGFWFCSVCHKINEIQGKELIIFMSCYSLRHGKTIQRFIITCI